MGMPIILSMYLKPNGYSQHCLIATNSLPSELLYDDFCFLDSQKTGAPVRYTINPVLDLLVTLSPAKSASNKVRIINSFPIALGALSGNNSLISS